MAEFTKVEGRDIGDIRIYTLSTCGWCAKTKAFLKDRGIAYSYLDVDLLDPDELGPVRIEQQRYNPGGSFPTIVVNGADCIVGFDEERLQALTEGADGR